jgi:glyoxylase-like metal-dependent hydrolase (beta-lactamase superfamily II)
MLSRRSVLASAAALATAPLLAHAKAPLQGVLPASIHRYKAGAFEITALLDGQRAVDKPETNFGIDQKPEDVAALLKANHLPTDKMALSFTPILVNTGKELILFDTGLGPAARPKGGNLNALIAQAGLTTDQVDVVVITHCHPDHIGGLMENGEPLCKNARYIIGEAEYGFWSSPDRLSGPTEQVGKLVQANVVPLAPQMAFVNDGGDAVGGIRAYFTPGHTRGHMSWHLESEGSRLLVGADFCNHFVLSMQKPDWHTKFDADKEMAAQTRRKTLDMLATDRVAFTSYHMPFPSVGYVEKNREGGYHFVPATYQMVI